MPLGPAPASSRVAEAPPGGGVGWGAAPSRGGGGSCLFAIFYLVARYMRSERSCQRWWAFLYNLTRPRTSSRRHSGVSLISFIPVRRAKQRERTKHPRSTERPAPSPPRPRPPTESRPPPYPCGVGGACCSWSKIRPNVSLRVVGR